MKIPNATQKKCQKRAKKVKKEHEDKTPTGDLFTNPMVEAARAQMSEEDRKHYEKIGEEMYGNMDFETSKNLNNLPPPMVESYAYIISGLRPGLHPSALDNDEKVLMVEVGGKEWYKEFGYVKEDLEDIVTLDPKMPQTIKNSTQE